jgi:hypothetical protein
LGKIDIGQINAKQLRKIEDKIDIPSQMCETIQKTKIPINKKEVKVGKVMRVDYYVNILFNI